MDGAVHTIPTDKIKGNLSKADIKNPPMLFKSERFIRYYRVPLLMPRCDAYVGGWYQLRKPYRDTEAGGYNKTFVFTLHGAELPPKVSVFSRLGRHGIEIWMLDDGKYIVVDVSRPNNTNRPYEAVFYCVIVESNNACFEELFRQWINSTVDVYDYIEKAVTHTACTKRLMDMVFEAYEASKGSSS
jgi:hypothetical protein